MFNLVGACLLLGGGAAWAQQSKTYKESFTVDKDVEVILNTSHADIEFETWDRNEVAVEAVIRLEGASAEEAAEFFEDGPMEIMGSSTRVEVSTNNGDAWMFRAGQLASLEDLEIVIPDLPDLAPMLENLEIVIPEIPEVMVIPDLPPLPQMPPVPNFDYKAYEEDGEAYMKRWKEEFESKFDSDYQKRMEEWADRARERAEEMKERIRERKEEQAAHMEERAQQREEVQRQREQVQRQREEARAQMAEAREQMREERQRSRVFYMRGQDGDRNYSIEKVIRIKMPKNARLKLNVRHGEVKLAENAQNIKATLSYAKLLASTIGGEETDVQVRYSPITVKVWDGGRLNADFSDRISLDQVRRLSLSATSSDVTIDRLLREASLRNNLGNLRIRQVSDDFKDMTISVENGDLQCGLPGGAYLITVNNKSSEVAAPSYIVWEGAGANASGLQRGYHQQKDAGRSIVINASYSEVSLEK